jgi:hypothetical protein
MKIISFRRNATLFGVALAICSLPAMSGIVVNGFGTYLGVEGSPVQISNSINYLNTTVETVASSSSNSFTYTRTSTFGLGGTLLLDVGGGTTQLFTLAGLGGNSIANLSQFSSAPYATNNQPDESISGSFIFGLGTNLISEDVTVATETISSIFSCVGIYLFGGTCNNVADSTTRTFGSDQLMAYTTVNVANLPPVVIDFTNSILTRAGQPFSYGVTATDFEPLTYSWDLNGDGTYGDSSSANGVFTLNTVGTYGIGVRISDGLKMVERFGVVQVGKPLVSTVPEPASLVLVLTCLGIMFSLIRRRNSN